jgi:hypothetical protein
LSPLHLQVLWLIFLWTVEKKSFFQY